MTDISNLPICANCEHASFPSKINDETYCLCRSSENYEKEIQSDDTCDCFEEI